MFLISFAGCGFPSRFYNDEARTIFVNTNILKDTDMSKLSKEQWLRVGLAAGWIQPKKAQVEMNASDEDKFIEGISSLPIVSEKYDSERETATHVERDPGSYWGGREVEDGETTTHFIDLKLQGDVFVPYPPEQAKTNIKSFIADMGREFNDAVDKLVSEDAPSAEDLSISPTDIQVVEKDAGNRIYSVMVDLHIEGTSFKSKHDIIAEMEDARADDLYDQWRERD